MVPVIIGAWLAIGVVSVAVMHRRGHDTFAWAVPFLFLGTAPVTRIAGTGHSVPVLVGPGRP